MAREYNYTPSQAEINGWIWRQRQIHLRRGFREPIPSNWVIGTITRLDIEDKLAGLPLKKDDYTQTTDIPSVTGETGPEEFTYLEQKKQQVTPVTPVIPSVTGENGAVNGVDLFPERQRGFPPGMEIPKSSKLNWPIIISAAYLFLS